MKKAVVLGADNGYMDKVETTIKSVCAHNDHIKFYVFNDDLPSEWFRVMNKRLKTIHSEIVNVKISDHSFRNYRLAISYLSYAAYFHYFIGEFVEEERAIYLDSDIIVTGSLDNLYNVDLEEYMLAGVPDYFDGDYTGDFNSGMMVIPVTRWKQKQVASRLLELTEQYHQTVFGDQGILNILFRGQWKKLNRLNNFMVGMDTLAQSVSDRSWYDSALPEGVYPLIIHYTGDKPWYHLSNNRYRSTWWFYYSVDWSDVLLRKNPINENEVGNWHTLIESPEYYTAIFTDSCELEQIEKLLKELPQVHFTILAHTIFASSVIDLQKYGNVSIYSGFTPFNLDDIMSKLDFYLDINHGNQIADIINKVHNIGKSVYAFDVTNHDNCGRSKVFSVSEVDLMINEIKLELDFKKTKVSWMDKVIALGADNGYMDKVETTIKSVCAHNDNIKFYVFNDDLPSEWFRVMNKRLEKINSQIVNAKISDNQLRKYHLPRPHLSYAAYFRFFIPEVVEEERVLYLDSDIVVDGDLTDLFETDLGDCPLAAVRDDLQQTNFNSGVMLINNKYWREHDISTQLFEVADQYHEYEYGDQGLLNRYFIGQWKELDMNYNFMVGMDSVATSSPQSDEWYIKAKQHKKVSIIHYTAGKPWQAVFNNRLGDRWWFYYALDWSDVLLRTEITNRDLGALTVQEPYHTAIFTNACEMEHLEYLIQALPNVHFHILAHTVFASQVVDLQRYLNVTIYPCFNRYNFETVLEKIDFYLDINHFNEIMSITQEVHKLGKPIYAFDNTSKDQSGESHVYPVQNPEMMVEEIKSYLATLAD